MNLKANKHLVKTTSVLKVEVVKEKPKNERDAGGSAETMDFSTNQRTNWPFSSFRRTLLKV